MFKYIFPESVWLNGMVFTPGTPMSIGIYLLCLVAVMAAAYVCGSVNSAIIFSKLLYKEDIRTKGSGNAGMTNMMRNYGISPAAMTLIGDMLKTMVGMIIGTLLLGVNGAYIAGLFCVLGHVIPVFYNFKGGKGVAATVMIVLYLDLVAFLLVIAVFALVVWATKYLSLGSVMLALTSPLILYRNDPVVHDRPIRLFITFIIAGIVVFLHRANIKRVMNGTESKFKFKKTAKTAQVSEEPKLASAEETEESSVKEEEITEEVLKRKEINRKKSAKKKK
ncbi:MAG: glycerol-3-phosphate 1-O-acyltransferase PlsY [Clostridia bacterium]|nr:glycerol-3-phosphate 1-O-acyltransferase PlsY [Clostridia bacterium]